MIKRILAVWSLVFYGCGKTSIVETPLITPAAPSFSAAASLSWATISPSFIFAVNPTWTLATGGTIASQSIQYYSDGSCSGASGAPVALTTSATTANFTGSDFTTYSYKITSVDTNGNTAVSNCSSAMVLSSQACVGARLTNSPYAGGTGTIGDPYFICTGAQMNAIGLTAADWNKNFILYTDISLASYTGTQYNIIGNVATNFTGVFDGNNHTISDLSISIDTLLGVGLFGYVSGGSAEIKNLTLSNVNLLVNKGDVSMGAFVGIMNGGSLTNLNYASGSIVQTSGRSLQNIGGIAGSVTNGTLAQLKSAAAFPAGISANIFGGLVGLATTTTISNSFFSGSTDPSLSAWYSGGVVGQLDDSTITQSYFTGSLSAGPGSGLGGLVGYTRFTSDITKSYSSGSVDGNTFANGGLVGSLGSAAGHGIFNSYSTTNVTGFSNAGGLVGKIEIGNPSVTNCYATGIVDGFVRQGGLIGDDNGVGARKGVYSASYWNNQINVMAAIGAGAIPAGITAANTATLQNPATFSGAGWTSPTWNLTTAGMFLKLGWQP